MTELEQYCILAKTQKGRACASLVQQVINHKKIFVFGELLNVPSIQALCDSEFSKEFHTLRLFAFGSYQDYFQSTSQFIDLSDSQLYKLRQLSVLSLVAQRQTISYDNLMDALGLTTVRDLEDLLISTIYAGLLEGKMDHLHRVVRIGWVQSRDIEGAELPSLVDKLSSWRSAVERVEGHLEQTNSYVRGERERHQSIQKDVQERYVQQRSKLQERGEVGNNWEDYEEGEGGEMEVEGGHSLPALRGILGPAAAAGRREAKSLLPLHRVHEK